MPLAAAANLATRFCPSFGAYSQDAGLGSVERLKTFAGAALERMYAQSASGKRSSQRTWPPDSRSSKMQSSARNDWWRLAAFRRYPSVVPHAVTYADRSPLDKEFRYLSNLSMSVIYPQVKLESIPMGHLPASKLLFECRMDKYEIRRLNLRALLHSHCGGRAATLADLIGRSPSYVSRMLYAEGKEGKKRIGEDMRDIIEDALSLSRGSLDRELTDAAEGVKGAPSAESHSAQAKDAAPVLEQASAQPTTTLERLDAAEKSILELYRRSTDDGKVIIRRAADVAPKTDD